MFFRKRVYQGSSGRVYPLVFHAALSDERTNDTWEFITLENAWLTVELLPQLGGRIFSARERCSGYDLFYRQPVIKPALVGLTGPWISGGVEFNWPQHHRPTTYLPADRAIEYHGDGSVTVWMGEHEPMDRMKEAHGVRLDPHSSRIELNVRLFNRTPMRHSVMWWANLAAETHDCYQAFFPPDVDHVADHAVRAMSSFPIARNDYYGIDYRPGTDLTWYRNIPVPTSYMVLRSDYAFFGGYDHAADAGFVHVADRHVAPGKKQWTWGNAEFGRAWDRELTDARDDGSYPPYVELMAGVYTNNQPDFTYLGPYEAKTFRQVWWPIRGLGPVQQASERAAIRMVVDDDRVDYGVVASESLTEATFLLKCRGDVLASHRLDLEPSEGHRFQMRLPSGCEASEMEAILEWRNELVLRYRAVPPHTQAVPPLATEPPPPERVDSSDRLYFIGEHVEQYRHPTREPEQYWLEAIHRDPGDARSRVALGRRCLRHGRLQQAVEHFEVARDRITEWHPNPESGEVAYLLGLCYRRLRHMAKAEAAFGKAAWDEAFASPAMLEMARLMGLQGRWAEALDRATQSAASNPDNHTALCLVASLLRRSGHAAAALRHTDKVLRVDPLCFLAAYERSLCLRAAGDAREADDAAAAMFGAIANPQQTMLDVALDYADGGLWDDAWGALRSVDGSSCPSLAYATWWVAVNRGDDVAASRAASEGLRLTEIDLFPVRPQEETILSAASEHLVDDANAPYLLGCLLYDRRRIEEASDSWRRSIKRRPGHAGAHRGLGLIAYNDRHDAAAALSHFESAFDADPEDDQLLYELDQLHARCGTDPERRIARLDAHPRLVERRSDLTLARILLLNLLGREAQALSELAARRFHPWEGGEGKALAQYTAARLGLGVASMTDGSPAEAVRHFMAAIETPRGLGEARHPLAATADIEAHIGWALLGSGDPDAARHWLEKAASARQDFSDMSVRSYSPMTFYNAWALQLLKREDRARAVLDALLEHARSAAAETARIDYFATSLPNLLVFEEDLQSRHELECRFMEVLALRGLGRPKEADPLLQRIVQEDPNHLGARQMLRWSHLACLA